MSIYEKLIPMIRAKKGLYLPADPSKMNQYRIEANVAFDKEYIDFQTTVGMVSVGSFESYGISLPEGHFLSTIGRLKMHREMTKDQFPVNLVPLFNQDEHVDICYSTNDKKLYQYNMVTGTTIYQSGNIFMLFQQRIQSA